MKKKESQAIHFHPFNASPEAKKKETSLFIYILAMLKQHLEIQIDKKCALPVEIGLHTLYQNLALAPPDADLHKIIKDANPDGNRVLKNIL